MATADDQEEQGRRLPSDSPFTKSMHIMITRNWSWMHGCLYVRIFMCHQHQARGMPSGNAVLCDLVTERILYSRMEAPVYKCTQTCGRHVTCTVGKLSLRWFYCVPTGPMPMPQDFVGDDIDGCNRSSYPDASLLHRSVHSPACATGSGMAASSMH